MKIKSKNKVLENKKGCIINIDKGEHMKRLEQMIVSEIAKFQSQVDRLKAKEQLYPSELLELDYCMDQVWLLQQDLVDCK